jgi:hypothetical protein
MGWRIKQRDNDAFVRFEVLTVLTAVRMTMLFFWVVTPCRLVGTQLQG